MSRRSGPKPWRVYDGDTFLAGCWTGIGAATTAHTYARVQFHRDLPADTRIECVDSGESLRVGPHTPVKEVDQWVGERESRSLRRWLTTSFTVSEKSDIH